jgi:hypothetical protein
VTAIKPAAPPSFSVIIPAYQAAATIGHALASLRDQTVAPAEILVCDDGSEDDLDRALEPHRDAIRLLRQPHRGATAARNALTRAAAADFVVPLDADDVYAPTRLECLGELGASRPDLDILGTDATFVVDGEVTGRFGAGTPFAVERQAEAILDRCFLICPAMRREAVLAVGGYDESLRTAEDWDLCIRMIQKGARAGLVDEPLLEYRMGPRSLTSRRGETLTDRVRVLEKAERADLPESERRTLGAALARNRARALQQAALDAVASSDPAARRRLIAVARSRDVGLRARAGALFAALVPARAGRILQATLSESTGRPPATSRGSTHRPCRSP